MPHLHLFLQNKQFENQIEILLTISLKKTKKIKKKTQFIIKILLFFLNAYYFFMKIDLDCFTRFNIINQFRF